MKFNKSLLALLAMTYIFSACSDDTSNDPAPNNQSGPNTAKVKVKLEHVWDGMNGAEVKLNTSTPYISAQGDSITLTTLNYYISNVRLVRTDDTEFVPTDSYYLVRVTDATGNLEIEIPNVPLGEYKGIHYMIGVDSAKVVEADLSLAPLQPSNGMFWSWNTGFIFVKCEGSSPQVARTSKTFAFHVGGYKFPNSAIQMINHDFGSSRLRVANNSEPELHVYVDVKKFFTGPGTNIQLSNFNNTNHAPGPFNMNIATNYREMFLFDHIHN